MIIPNKRFLIGGMANKPLRAALDREAKWFGVNQLRLVDDVVKMCPLIHYTFNPNQFLNKIFEMYNLSKMPQAEERWRNIEIAPLRIYYLIKECLKKADPATWLYDMIRLEGNYITIKEAHEPGDNR